MKSLSILIPSVISRMLYLRKIIELIYNQRVFELNKIEILINVDDCISPIGKKRNDLLNAATGKYIVFIDDDDEISDDYLEQIFKGIDKDVDHIGITMLFSPDIGVKKLVKCSKNNIWEERDNIYYRSAQHVCPIRATIAKQVKYPEINFGEDKEYSLQINKLIQTEYLIDKPIYIYKYRTNK